MRNIVVEIANEVNLTGSGEAAAVDTVGARDARQSDAAFYLNVTSLTGTSPTADFDITATLDGIDYVLGSFAQATGVTNERIVITDCPDVVKVEYTLGGTVTDLDYTVTCIRR